MRRAREELQGEGQEDLTLDLIPTTTTKHATEKTENEESETAKQAKTKNTIKKIGNEESETTK